MTIRYAKTTEDAIRAIYDGISAAQDRLMGVHKAMAEVARWRGQYLKEPVALHHDLEIMEQNIQRQVESLELEIILYRRFFEDIRAGIQ